MINQRKLETDKQIDLDARIEKARFYGIAAAEIGLGMFPATRVMRFGGKIAQRAFKNYLGRRTSESIGKGAVAGLVSGGINNTVEAIKEKKNPLTEGLKGAAKGAATGALTAGAGAKAEKVIRGKVLSSSGDSRLLPHKGGPLSSPVNIIAHSA